MTKEFGICGEIGSAIPKLAPDLNFIQDTAFGSGAASIRTTANIDPSSGLTPVLNLIGKFEVSMLQLANITGGDATTVRMTVDGVVIWNSSKVFGVADPGLMGAAGAIAANGAMGESFICNSSLLIEIQTTTDVEMKLNYRARPIL